MKQAVRFGAIVAILVTSTFALSAKSSGFSWGGEGDEVAFFDDASVVVETRVADGKFPALDRFYKELFYAPLWVKAKGLSPFGSALLRLIRADATITPSTAVYAENNAVRKAAQSLTAKHGGTLKEKVALEMMFSKLYLHYARYRIDGGIAWQKFKTKLSALEKKHKAKFGWDNYAPPASPASVLNDALGDGDLARAFRATDPSRFGYAKLQRYLIKFIHISEQGGWPTPPSFGTLKPGSSSARIVPLLRKRLSMEGDLIGCSVPTDSPKYDPCMVKAVKRFQLRHGLKGNGVIGKSTRAAFGMTITQAIQKLRLNLDRIKWLERKKSRVRIELNIPSFRLNFLNGPKLVTTIRVVTGKPDHPTPTFHNVMKYIVVNPYWKIPESIVRHEMLKHLIRDPYHYEAQGKELHASWAEDSPRIDPGTVSWSKYRDESKHIPYYFMQVPSRKNALGKIKFLFPNGYSVYIHDTPSKSLFFRNQRAFSHGCMRIQKPRELLESLSLFNKNIDVNATMKRLEGTEKKTVVLNHYVPVDITYLTAFVDPYGNLNFRKDVYRYDRYQMKDYATKCVSLKGHRPPVSDPSPAPLAHPKAAKTPTPPASKPKAKLKPKPKSKPTIAAPSPTSATPISRKTDEDGYNVSEVY